MHQEDFSTHAVVPRGMQTPCESNLTLCDCLFADDVVGPFHQGNVDRDITPLGVPILQVCLRDPTGPGAGSSGKHRDALIHNLRHCLA